MDGFWAAIASPVGAVVAAGIIAAVGTGAFIWFSQEYRSLVKAVRRALTVVQVDGSDGALAQRLDAVRDDLQEIPHFGDLWSAYVTHNVAVDADGQVWRLGPSEAVFDPETIIPRFVHTQLFSAIPGILTGLGLLGTFLGLAGGLALAREGLTSQNLMDMVSSLRALLGGASTAFYTSIVGLVCSIAFNGIYRYRLRSVHRMIGRFNETVDAISERSDATIVVEGYSQLRKQSDLLAELRDGLIDALHQQVEDLGQQFHSHVVAQLVPKLEQVANTLDRMASNQVQLQQEQMTDLATRFQEVLTANAGAHLQTLTSTLNVVTEQLQAITASLLAGNELIRSGTAEAATQLERAVETTMQAVQSQMGTLHATVQEMFGAMQDEIEGLRDKLRSSVEVFGQDLGHTAKSFGQIMEHQARDLQQSFSGLLAVTERLSGMTNATTQELQKVLTELRVVHQGLTESIQQARSLPDTWGRLLQEGKALTNELRSASSHVVAAAQQQKALGDALREATVTLRQQADTMASAWEEYRSRFEEVDRALADVVQQLTSGAASFGDVIKSCIEHLDKSFEQGTNYLSAAVSGLGTVVEDMEEEVTRLREVLRAIRQPASRQP